MISYLNLLSGIGMIAVGAGAILYWYLKKHPKIEYFLYGAIFWACAIAIKLAMDLTITQPIQSYFKSTLPILAVLLIMSLYVGLRTGIFESGIVYVAVKYLKLSKMSCCVVNALSAPNERCFIPHSAILSKSVKM